MWTIRVDIPPPMSRDGKPRFGIISKNSRIHRYGKSFWSREAKEWGETMQWLVKAALLREQVEAGDADYQITLEVFKPDRRRLDSQNLIWLVSDFLQGVLDCDDSQFAFVTPTPVVSDDPRIRLTIQKLQP